MSKYLVPRVWLSITVLIASLCLGCKEEGSETKPSASTTAPSWRTDASAVTRAFPPANGISSTRWRIVETESKGMVPAPGSVRLVGAAVLTEANVASLLQKYSWQPSEKVPAEALEAVREMGMKQTSELKYSQDLIRALPQLSTYHSGVILLDADQRILLFDLRKN